MSEGRVRRLSSGYWRLEAPSGDYVQVPPGFTGREGAPGWEDVRITERDFICREGCPACVDRFAHVGPGLNRWFRDQGVALLTKLRAALERSGG